MTAKATLTGASSACKASASWQELPWHKVKKQVFQLQVRIAKAEREGRRGKVKALQRLLTSSFYAKCLAVKRVTSNSGGKTPGIDGVTWNTDLKKMIAVSALKRKGYKPLPLRRIYIPKKSGTKLRPLSIPALGCRAQQALHLLALEPIVEERADPNAYGFRLKRSAHDAIDQCFKALGKGKSATYVLEGDIRDCFCEINHGWLLENIPMDKTILGKFLKAGFMEKGQLFPTERGAAQGSVISPALLVLTLSGIERQLVSPSEKQRCKEKINMISYADDFVVTAASQELLEQKVKPILEKALGKVGLELSTKKTKITHIKEGFDFLGFNVRKYRNGKLWIKPSKANITRFLRETRTLIKKGVAWPTDQLICALNDKITGWVNYYRTVVSSKVFSKIDNEIFLALKRWGLKRHARKGKRWIINHYYTRYKGDNWRFHCKFVDKRGNKRTRFLKCATDTKIRRHIKIVATANPFNPVYKEYFEAREKERQRRCLLSNDTELTGLKIIQPYEGLSPVP
jgi:RNA-directed DNA polymerase